MKILRQYFKKFQENVGKSWKKQIKPCNNFKHYSRKLLAHVRKFLKNLLYEAYLVEFWSILVNFELIYPNYLHSHHFVGFNINFLSLVYKIRI